jgi:hypothetical protein
MTRLGLVAALVVLGLAEVHGQSQTLAAIRAAFVVNLVEFVDWAAGSTGGSEPLALGVLDDRGCVGDTVHARQL